MVETNIRIVKGGMALDVAARRARVTGTHLQLDMLQRACSHLRSRHQLVATPMLDDASALVVACNRPIPTVALQGEDWAISIEDAGELPPLTLDNVRDRAILPVLVERAVLGAVAVHTRRWVIAGAPRIWYEPRSLRAVNDIAAYRRVAVSAFLVEDVGIGVAIDTQTTFLTANTLAWFFDPQLSTGEARRRRELFDRLAERERGQGTLLYNRGGNRSTCYFVEARPRLTCATTGQLRFGGETYASLFDYYGRSFPNLDVSEEDATIDVSFRIGPCSVPVAAKFLQLRVFNDALPRQLQELIPIPPEGRRDATLRFWRELGETPLGSLDSALEDGLWVPTGRHLWQIRPPTLRFGGDSTLRVKNGLDSYRDYWNERTKLLATAGCFQCPPILPRVIHCAFPRSVPEEAIHALLTDVREWLRKWTGKAFNAVHLPYERVDCGIADVQILKESGLLLFVINDERNAYFDVSLHLGDRRPQHMAADTLTEHFDKLKNGSWDQREHKPTMRRGRILWDSFAGLVAINLLQLHDGVPWATEASPFEAMVAVDVGHDCRHYGLSALIVRTKGTAPEFRLQTEISPKADAKHESINPVILRDEVVNLFRTLWPKRAEPLRSLLFVRDGRICGQEATGIEEARQRLIADGILAATARVEVVDFPKNTSRRVRLWDVREPGRVENVVEGTALEISRDTVILANTGRTTLRQGTVEPVAIIAQSQTERLRDAAKTCFFAAQLNWSNPRVAQRLPLPVSRTDGELIARARQEARHTR